MNFKIHRGTQEIGGSCVEVWTHTTRIVIDIGMPLMHPDGSEFDISTFQPLTKENLLNKGVLPNIPGLYKSAKKPVDGVLISHYHKDHYGLGEYVSDNIKFYLGKATHQILEINNLFTSQNLELKNHQWFAHEKSFNIGDIQITPFLTDHSAFDAYAFLIEAPFGSAQGAKSKRIFYSGDFRGHGAKHKLFKWFTYHPPKHIDYLLMEGTTLGRKDTTQKTEEELGQELTGLFRQKDRINLVYCSGQNIDRIVRVYCACVQAGKTLVVDVYVAHILKVLSEHAGIPYPSKEFVNVRVMFPWALSDRLIKGGNENVVYQFTKYKITRDEIGKNPADYVLIVRPSLLRDLKKIRGMENGNFIYSLWKGYLNKPGSTKDFVEYFTNHGFTLHHLHTSGHADLPTLKRMVSAIKPKVLIPIHTLNGSDYKNHFDVQVRELSDGEIVN